MKKVLSFVMLFAFLLSVVAPFSAFAEQSSEREIIFKEDFSSGKVNTSSDVGKIKAANGLWVNCGNGSRYEIADGALKYTETVSADFADIRFYYPETAHDLRQSFVLSFKLKPKMPNMSMEFAWRDYDHDKYDTSLKLSHGRVKIGGSSYSDGEVYANEWNLFEVAFHYNSGKQAVTGETGAIDYYTVMINGKRIARANTSIMFNNIDAFRLFQWANCEYELDDLTIALGEETLAQPGEYEARAEREWYIDKEPAKNYAYSFAIVGDTQVVAKHAPKQFTKIYDWILANKASKKIEYVFGLGDITNDDSVAEWTVSAEAINKMNGVVPYSLIRGNHDSSAKINEYFYNETYNKQFEGFYGEGSMENSWRRLTVGETKYLMITLDYGAKDEILKWAGEVIEQYPDHRVIITTHAYLYPDGTTVDEHDSVPPSSLGASYNNGDEMWDKLVSKYENIFLIISGHESCDYVITNQREGEKGNVVTEMLVDPQGVDGDMGCTGMITMLYFSEDGKEIEVETYSTINKGYFLAENQFKIDISTWAKDTPKTEEPPVADEMSDDSASVESDGAGAQPTEEKKGCGSIIYTSSLALGAVVLCASAVLIKKRKRE